MIIYNSNFCRITLLPFKNNPPLIIYPDAIEITLLSRQFLKSVWRRNSQVSQILRVVEHPELSSSDLLNVRRQIFYSVSLPDFFSLSGSKRQNHNTYYVTNVKDKQLNLICQIIIPHFSPANSYQRRKAWPPRPPLQNQLDIRLFKCNFDNKQ